MRILISAAEASSDAHGAQLLRALKAQASERGAGPIDAYGVGGPKLQAEGLRAVVDARDLLVMGLTEVLGRLPKILRSLRRVADAAAEHRPDVAVVIDYPDFHFKLAKRLSRLGVPVIYYIPPKVWVWRKGRLRKMRRLFARVLSILPFEEPMYRDAGIPVKYVGNPLLDELPLELTREEARAKLGLLPDARVLLLMPGSRPAELKRHVPVMLESLRDSIPRLRSAGFLLKQERLQVLMPLPATADRERARAQLDAEWRRISGAHSTIDSGFELHLSQGDSAIAMKAADLGIVKSGTSTLEAGLLGCVHSIIYKPSGIVAFIFKKVIRFPGPVGLVNLVYGWAPGKPFLVREILMEQVTAPALADEIVALASDGGKRASLERGFAELRAKVLGDAAEGGPSARAAREVLDFIEARAPMAAGAAREAERGT